MEENKKLQEGVHGYGEKADARTGLFQETGSKYAIHLRNMNCY